jgi:hypothetical protein
MQEGFQRGFESSSSGRKGGSVYRGYEFRELVFLPSSVPSLACI